MKAPAAVPLKAKTEKKKALQTKKEPAVEGKKKLTPQEEAANLLEEKLRQQRL